MIYAQALINPRGPAGECLVRGSRGEFTIIVSSHVLGEIAELPQKLPPRFAVTNERIAAFLRAVVPATVLIEPVPHVFDHPVDPDDAPYVDLAVAADARLIVSRDRHLLGLMDPAKAWSAEFRRRFPQIQAMVVERLLDALRAKSAEAAGRGP
jgi:putative PIN family toxin of toxin-antitoxin system